MWSFAHVTSRSPSTLYLMKVSGLRGEGRQRSGPPPKGFEKNEKENEHSSSLYTHLVWPDSRIGRMAVCGEATLRKPAMSSGRVLPELGVSEPAASKNPKWSHVLAEPLPHAVSSSCVGEQILRPRKLSLRGSRFILWCGFLSWKEKR